MSTQFTQVQNLIMGRLTTIERNQSAPRPQFTRQQRYATGWKPRPQREEKASDTLKAVGMVDTEALCLPCQEPHREDECSRRDEDSLDDMNFMDMIFVFHEEHVTRTDQRSQKTGRKRGETLGLESTNTRLEEGIKEEGIFDLHWKK
jgi:hypothetical protein